MQRAFDEIDAALAEGELVCIFPEGALTRDGAMAPFKSGVEKILQRRLVPVVPMALRGMWSSMRSRRDSRLGRMRVPRRFRATVEVVAAPAVDGHSTSAPVLEAQVRTARRSRSTEPASPGGPGDSPHTRHRPVAYATCRDCKRIHATSVAVDYAPTGGGPAETSRLATKEWSLAFESTTTAQPSGLHPQPSGLGDPDDAVLLPPVGRGVDRVRLPGRWYAARPGDPPGLQCVAQGGLVGGGWPWPCRSCCCCGSGCSAVYVLGALPTNDLPPPPIKELEPMNTATPQVPNTWSGRS